MSGGHGVPGSASKIDAAPLKARVLFDGRARCPRCPIANQSPVREARFPEGYFGDELGLAYRQNARNSP